jgi:hypothetical protein
MCRLPNRTRLREHEEDLKREMLMEVCDFPEVSETPSIAVSVASVNLAIARVSPGLPGHWEPLRDYARALIYLK